MHGFTTLVTYPTTVYPTPYTYVNGVALYTAMDRFAAYAHANGCTHEEARALDTVTDLREIELSNAGIIR